jgi:uncharacterized protein GlcG (DUF336 family)
MHNDFPPPLELRYGPPIGLDEAEAVIAAAAAAAAERRWPMAIAVVDSGGHLVAFRKRDHTQLGSGPIAIAKAQTANHFKRPSKVLEDAVTAGGQGLRVLATPGITPLEGGLPLVRDGAVIGAIGVSGLQSHQDLEIAVAGAAALSLLP